MIRKQLSSLPNCVRVVFELPSCLWAEKVFLAGDFNDWSTTTTPLLPNPQGIWQVTLDLPAERRFQFRYLVDGRWMTDHHADGIESNRYSTDNSIVDTHIPARWLALEAVSSMVHEDWQRGKEAFHGNPEFEPAPDVTRDLGSVSTPLG